MIPPWLYLVMAVIGGVHGWALLRPAGRVDMALHRLWRTECSRGYRDGPHRLP